MIPVIPAEVRAIAFDAVGTLIHTDPAPGVAYALIGARFGSLLPEVTVRARFRSAFARQEQIDRLAGWRTDDGREEQRWRAIVAEVLDDVADREGCFRALWDHFASPTAWRADSEVGAVLTVLTERGYRTALASNFDGRLHGLVAGLPALAPLGAVVVSSDVGWRKPAGAFFTALCDRLALAPRQVLLVGDDAENDVAGASAAGLPARLLDPAGGPGALARLRDLLA